jgi:hypothetical protein
MPFAAVAALRRHRWQRDDHQRAKQDENLEPMML